MRFEAVVFDFDGVLVESVDVKTRAFVELYRPHGEAVMAAVAAYHLANGGVSRLEKFRHFHRAFLGRELAVGEERVLADRFSALVEDAVVAAPWVPGAREFVSAYHKRIPLYVASATPTDELLRIVRRRGMEAYFRYVAGAPQPKGEILRRLIADGGHTAERVLMVGDATTDLTGARQAGTAFLGRVPSGMSNPFPAGIDTVSDLERLAACLGA